MATVTGMTAARAQVIEDEAMASAAVDGNGDLIITRNNAAPINAGSVIGPQGVPGPTGDVSTQDLTDIGIAGMKFETGLIDKDVYDSNPSQRHLYSAVFTGQPIVFLSVETLDPVADANQWSFMIYDGDNSGFRVKIYKNGTIAATLPTKLVLNWIAFGQQAP